ncbi:AMP-binding protein [Micromonospora sp. NPDC005087]|uniref:AMP-binding protein n=1 Tax=Micromonospora sp. NPDC005087 TaxID=3364225 RepID=UPI0036B8667D
MLKPTRPAPRAYREQGYWADRTLTSYLVTAPADRLALTEGGRRFTYGELTDLTGRLAGALAGIGVHQHDVVTVELPNWWEAALTFHALAWAGCVTNPVVPIYRQDELTFILRQARSAVVVVPHVFRGFDYVEMMREILPRLDHRPTVVVVRPQGPLPEDFVAFDDLLTGADRPEPVGDPDDICLLLYTSGTTSEAKGVLHNHQTIVFEMQSIIDWMALTEDDRTFMGSPVGHLTGIVYGVWLPTLLRQSTSLLDVWEPGRAVDIIEGDRCTFSLGATPFLRGLVDEYARRGTPSALTTFLCGGADVPPALIRQARRQLDATVSRSYGSSELPVYCTSGPAISPDIAAETDGLPIPPDDGYLINVTDGVGELVARGPELFLGYLDPALNAEAFTPDGFFRTGDLATISPEGAVAIQGRSKDIIIRGGENISAAQVEQHLLEHPAIADVAVVAMPDEKLGEKACAFVVAAAGADPVAPPDLVAFLTGRGVAIQKCPERVETVAELPRTPSGKIQKFLLREQVKALIGGAA